MLCPVKEQADTVISELVPPLWQGVKYGCAEEPTSVVMIFCWIENNKI